MATLLTFQPSEAKRRAPQPGEMAGKILLFNGVRYERHDAAVHPADPADRRAASADIAKTN